VPVAFVPVIEVLQVAAGEGLNPQTDDGYDRHGDD
jgi:hypothetical protein